MVILFLAHVPNICFLISFLFVVSTIYSLDLSSSFSLINLIFEISAISSLIFKNLSSKSSTVTRILLVSFVSFSSFSGVSTAIISPLSIIITFSHNWLTSERICELISTV